MAARRPPPSIFPPARVRFGGSFALAFVLHTSAAAALMAAGPLTAPEKVLVEVELAIQPPEREPTPEVEPVRAPEPEPQPAVASPKAPPSAPIARPRIKRPEQKPAQELAAGTPAAAEQPLLAAGGEGWADKPVAGGGGGTAEHGATSAPAPAPVIAAPAPKAAPPAALAGPVALPGNAEPHYSLAARLGRVQGAVVVSFEVLEDGRVANARIVSGPQDLHETVLVAVASWRFKPARRGDTPIRVRKTQTILFRLEAG